MHTNLFIEEAIRPNVSNRDAFAPLYGQTTSIPVQQQDSRSVDQTQGVLSVRVSWNGIVQSAEEILLDAKGNCRFTVGEDPSADFLVPKESIGGAERFTLAAVTGGSLEIAHLPTMSFQVRDVGGEGTPLQDTSLAPRAAGHDHHGVAPGSEGAVTLGPWSFDFRLERRAAPVKGSMNIDRRTGYFFGFSFFLHAVLLFVFYLVPPNAAGFSFDETANNNRYIKVILGVQEAVNQVEQQMPTPEKKPEAAGGKAHADISGEMGDRYAERTRNRSGLKGRPDNPTPHMAREQIKEMAATSGVLSLLAAEKMPRSPFGEMFADGFDPENALGALTGDEIGLNLGMGGLGPKGTGRGGGGDGRNTIGVGAFGRIAWTKLRGTCTGPDCDFTGSASGGMRGRKGADVVLNPGVATVKGSLSKDVIRRIVRRHLNEIKFCYEKGLRKRPDLSGRVAVRFLIEPTGGVKTAVVTSSTTGDLAVDQCIAQTVSRMTFPMPKESGIVLVTYPFTLTASEG